MPAAIGDNSMNAEVGDRSLYMHHFRAIRAARAKVDEAKAVESDLRKKAKVDGIVLADINYGLRIVSIKDDSIIVDEAVRHIRIQRWMGLPIGAEPELDFEREPLIERAEREGFAAGNIAAERASPYGDGSEATNVYLAAYDRAQAEVQANWLVEQQRRASERQAAARAKPNGAVEDEGEGNADMDDEDDAAA